MSEIREASWGEFRAAGRLWFVNRLLHFFGWAIVVELGGEDGEHVSRVYPARVSFRGFSEDVETEGFSKLTKHVEGELPRLRVEAGGA